MRILHKIFFCVAFLFFISPNLFSQPTNTDCASAAPFCTGQVMNFPALTGTSQAQAGPNYGCLGGQPRPTWFFMQILNSGPMVITMAAAFDIDFICWGPFPNLATACNSLTTGNTVDCSFSGSSTETCTINNAIAGQFYLLLITNWNGSAQNITFQQQNANTPGAATTNCGFVCNVTATNSGPICAGQSNTLSMSSSSAVTSYTWFGPNSFSSTSSFIPLSNIQATGTYTLRGTANATINNSPSTSTCQALTTITVVPRPGYSVSLTSPTICQGGNLSASVIFTTGILNGSAYSYTWMPQTGAGVFNPGGQNTGITPNLLPVNVPVAVVPYSVIVTSTTGYCPITQVFGITINNPLTPTLNIPPPLCNTVGIVNLSAAPGGGTWAATPFLTPNGAFNAAIAPTVAPSTVQYSVAAGNCIVSNTAAVYVSHFNTSALTTGLTLKCSQDPPINLMTIPLNTNTGVWGGGPFVLNNQFIPFNLPTGSYVLSYSTVSTPIASVCPSSTNLVVQVFNPPTPLIAPIFPVCNTAPTVALSASPAGGVWSQNSGVSVAGVQTPSLCNINNNSVVYTAGIGTCVATATANFHVSQFNTAALSNTIGHLCVTSNPVNLAGIVQSTVNGVWSGINVASGSTAGSYSFSPGGLPTGIYTLNYQTTSWPTAGLCDDSRTISVSVLNPPVPSINLAGPFCSRDKAFQMAVSPANSGSWTAFPYLNATGVFDPALASVGPNLVQYVTGTSTCSVQRTININVEAFVSAKITNRIPDQCNTGSPVSLLPITLSGAGNWQGNGVSGSNFDPAAAGAGNHLISYNTSSQPSGLCPDKDTLSVKVFSLATPVIVNAGPFCSNNGAIKLQVNPVGGIFAGTNNGAVTPAGLFNPALGVLGANIINYSISAGPCIAFAQTRVQVEEFIPAGFSNSQPIYFCQGQEPVNMDQFVFNPGGRWSGTGMAGNMFDPGKIAPGSNIQITYRTSSPNNALLCPDQHSVMVSVYETPTLQVSALPAEGCAPLGVNLTVKPSGTGQGKAFWYINSQNAEPLEGLGVNYVFNTPGTYSVLANFVTEQGCPAQASLLNPIEVKESPKADFVFEPQEITIANPEVTLSNLSSPLGNNSYVWTIQGASNQEFDVNPKVVLPAVGFFRVKLTATSFNGCKNEITKTIEVKNDFNVFIPSSFSPNADGINDVFIPVFSPFGLDNKSFDMEIFDRWGKSIFHSKDINKGWDGNINNAASSLKQDTYIYKIKFKDVEGRVYSKTGVITLMGN